MTSTLVGQLISGDGWNCRSYFSDDPEHFWNPIRHRTWVVDPAKLRPTQASTIPLRADHGTSPIGELVYLQRRGADGSLWCVADIDRNLRPLPQRDYYLSVEAEVNERDGGDVVINGAALCERSAMLGLAPIVWLCDGLDQRGRSQRRLGDFQRALLDRASEARERRRSEPLRVHDELFDVGDLDRLSTPERMALLEDQHEAWKLRPYEIRPSRIISVR